MISQNEAHSMLIDLKDNLKCSPENYDENEVDFINEFNFDGVQNHWFSFRQPEKIENLWNQKGFKG